MPSSLRTALLQSAPAPADALDRLDEAARRAAVDGARLLVTSELYLTGYTPEAGFDALAEPADGPSARAVSALAALHGLAVVHGYAERGADGRLHNSAALTGPDGTPLAHYRKTHLYGDHEHRWFTPGDRPVVQARLDGLTLGLLVCYDVEFPETVRAHALAGTDLLCVPTALAEPFTVVPDTLVPARAVESQLYVAYANRTGTEGPYTFAGRSCLAAPDGTVPVRGGRDEELLLADADPALLAASRADSPYLRDRRPELYG
ncbi:carbon-nitrogen hydrolase family protein [Streptomyces albidoflavus]